MSGQVSGREAIRIVLEEIGDVIGHQRLREMERKVRARMAADGKAAGGTGKDWIGAIAQVIVDDDDTRANAGFMRGIRRIREQAAKQ